MRIKKTIFDYLDSTLEDVEIINEDNHIFGLRGNKIAYIIYPDSIDMEFNELSTTKKIFSLEFDNIEDIICDYFGNKFNFDGKDFSLYGRISIQEYPMI